MNYIEEEVQLSSQHLAAKMFDEQKRESENTDGMQETVNINSDDIAVASTVQRNISTADGGERFRQNLLQSD